MEVPNENVLEDDYPIYADYWYVVDGKPIRSDWHGVTARGFRARIRATEIRRCNLAFREANGLAPFAGRV